MSVEAGGIAAVFGKSAGLFLAAVATAVVSTLAVVVGFTIVPLTPGKERVDIARRLAAGLLCSFTLGPIVAFKVIDWQPAYLGHWVAIVGQENVLVAYLGAAAPFLAFTAIAGFWIVAGFMRWFARREGKDIGELARDAKNDVTGLLP